MKWQTKCGIFDESLHFNMDSDGLAVIFDNNDENPVCRLVW